MPRAILAACFLLLVPQPAAAVTISVTGAPGTPGSDGESVVATAASEDAENSATATGGGGGDTLFEGVAPGDGGSAEATAETLIAGGGSGPSPVSVSAYAKGGNGGAFFVTGLPPAHGGRGGNARAESSAHSSGEVMSLATAIAGQGGFPYAPPYWSPSGMAEARASAIGTGGEARAEAGTSGFELWGLNAEASASVRSHAIVESRAEVGTPSLANSLGDVDTFAIAEGRPDLGEVQAATQGSNEVAGLFTGEAIDITLSLGRIGFTRLQEADGSAALQSAALTILPNPLEVSALQDVILGFSNPQFLGAGFDSLRFRANNRDETLIDVSFDELDEALDYFDDRILDLGGFAAGCTDGGGFGRRDFCFVSPLELIFDWTGSEQGDGFGVDLIVGLAPIPEPSSVLLMALGLAVLAVRARSRPTR
jgi:hypothetical protein